MYLVTSKHKGMSSKKNLKSVIKKIYFLLNNKYPETPCRLNHTDCFQLLLATMLSAQSTDEQVNMITKNLFKNFPEIKVKGIFGTRMEIVDGYYTGRIKLKI